jgi:drug/metabolite transporter (DMT)-like permease
VHAQVRHQASDRPPPGPEHASRRGHPLSSWTILALATLSALAAATGIFLTKGLTDRLPAWQTVAPLLLLNVLWVLPLGLLDRDWHLTESRVLVVHVISAVVLVLSTAAMFALIPRGKMSAVAVGQALSPAATVALAPLVLGVTVGTLGWLASAIVMCGAIWPVRRAFLGLHSAVALALMATVALGAGLLTVLSALLASWDVGVGEIFLVRTLLAGVVYLVIAPPRAVPVAAIPALASRSFFVSLGFVLAIIAVRDGDVALVQSLAATTPLLVVLLEGLRTRARPSGAVLIGSTVALVGAVALAAVA